jgi:serine/threonine protein kinase
MKSIGKYQVIEDLGSSATGKTYRVRDAFRNRQFAVKLLPIVPAFSAETKEQLCAHLAACAELTHRHIAKIHDLGTLDEEIFVATEWSSGTDLRRFMEENQDLPLGQKLAVIAQVAEGLAFAHSRGIAHGDLKPSNIFVDSARDVSILDFGSANWLQALLAAGCRPEGVAANYLAPEQVMGQPFDARSDIFTLGVMLYEFAAGKHPFAADPGLVPREIVHGEPVPLSKLSKLDAQVPEELERLVTRSLNKNPEQRLQTAEEFASGLYLAAQQLRRKASAAAPPEPTAVDQKVQEPVVDSPPVALKPEPMILEPAPPPEPVVQAELPPAPAAAPEPSSVVEVAAAPAPPVRERPQDAQPEPRPWTSRSYAASQPLSPVPSANPGKPPANRPSSPSVPPTAPAYQPPQSFLKEAVPEPLTVPATRPKLGKLTRRLLTMAAGLILAAAIVSSLVSRQNLKASQNKSRAVTAVLKPSVQVVKPPSPPATPVQETRTPKPGESSPDDIGNPEFSARQTLNGPVRSLWESGRYAQALALVNQVLANNPNNESARSWKKKIREAQAAEAALK